MKAGANGGDGGDGEPPKIEFPCDYPVKVLGSNVEHFEATILAVFSRHAPGFDPQTLSRRNSRKDTFVALTLTITATGPDQLEALHEDLLATGLVKIVF